MVLLRHRERIAAGMWLAAALAAAACGGETPFTPTAPSGSTSVIVLSAPIALRMSNQVLHLNSHAATFTWTPATSQDTAEFSWKVTIGTTSGSADVLSTTVSSPTYTWNGAQPGTYYVDVYTARGTDVSAASVEFQAIIVDLRDIVDALFFWAGPYSDDGTVTDTTLAQWPDGTTVTQVTSVDVTDPFIAGERAFTDQYIAGGGSTIAAYATTADTLLGISSAASVPANQVWTRMTPTATTTSPCPSALACTQGGPPEFAGDIGRALISMNGTSSTHVAVVGHELGHAYGLGHIRLPQPGRVYGLANPLMQPNANEPLSTVLTDYELEAFQLLRASGLRYGARRSQALAMGLVRATSSTSSASSMSGLSVGGPLMCGTTRADRVHTGLTR